MNIYTSLIARRWIVGLILMLAFLLRLSGLDNDLHRDRIYHPDSPKQAREIHHFLEGRYLMTGRGSAMDGYPTFASHAAALLYRSYSVARRATRAVMGLPVEPPTLDVRDAHRLMRMMNVVLSTLAVGLIFIIGRRFWTWTTGAIAALWLALSPIDIVAVKDATGDTLTAFLVLASIYFALRVLYESRNRDYFLGGLCAAGAYTSKYQGGIVLLPFLIAHLVRFPPFWPMLSAVSIRKGLLLIAGFIIGVVITMPAFLIDFEIAFRDMRRFMSHISEFGVPPEVLAMSPLQKMLTGLGEHIPTLWTIMGPVLFLAVMAGLLLGVSDLIRHRKGKAIYTPSPHALAAFWIVASLPLFYLLPGTALKPNAHIVYHTTITASLILLGASVLGRLWAWKKPLGVLIMGIILVISSINMAQHAVRENFFFRHNDTRLVAEAWALDTLPASMDLHAGLYTFPSFAWKKDPEQSSAHIVRAISEREIHRITPDAFVIHRIAFEDFKLTIFRNWNIYFEMRSPEWVRPGFHYPIPQLLPTMNPVNMVPVDAPAFVRSQKVLHLDQARRRSLILVSPEPLSDVLLTVRTGEMPVVLDIRVSGKRQTIELPNHSLHVVELSSLRSLRGLGKAAHFTPVDFYSRLGSAQIGIATAPREKAWAWYRAGDYLRAFQAVSALSERGPAEKLMYEISGLLSGNFDLASMPEDSEAFFDLFGLNPEYLASLSGLVFTAEQLDWAATENPEAIMDARAMMLRAPAFQGLDAGWYRVDIKGRRLPEKLMLEIQDHWGRSLKLIALEDPCFGEGKVTGFHDSLRTALVRIPDYWSILHLRVEGLASSDMLQLDHIEIRPDFPRTLDSFRTLRNGLRSTEAVSSLDPDPLHYRALLHRGDAAYVAGNTDEARIWFEAAQRAAPDRLQPALRLTSAPPPEAVPKVKAHAVFSDNVSLTGYRLDLRDLRPGGEIGLNLYWHFPALSQRVRYLGVGVHCIHTPSGTVVFQGDRSLLRGDMTFPDEPDEIEPALFRFPVPEVLPSGEYQIHVNIWTPMMGRRNKLLESDLPHTKRSVIVGKFSIPPT